MNKVEGIASVNVTLKRGVAHIALKPGNSVSLSQLRKIIKDAGYSTGEAVISARGTIVSGAEGLLLQVTGTGAALQVTADLSDPKPFTVLRKAAAGSSPVSVDVTGTVRAPAANQKGHD